MKKICTLAVLIALAGAAACAENPTGTHPELGAPGMHQSGAQVGVLQAPATAGIDSAAVVTVNTTSQGGDEAGEEGPSFAGGGALGSGS